MREILEARTLELASRGREERASGIHAAMLIAPWPEASWAFPVASLRSVVDTAPTPCPAGVTYNGLPCAGFLNFGSRVFPMVRWSDLAGLPPCREAAYAVSFAWGLALEIPSSCRLETLNLAQVEEEERPFCRGRVGEYLLADLEVER